MEYINAQDVLPKHLLEALQGYFEGGIIYVPKASDKKKWGEKSGYRRVLDQRNEAIRGAHKSGTAISHIAQHYHLSESAIKKILYR